jgi:hypothetical protein
MNDEAKMDRLYTSWCIAEFEADCLYDELEEDFTHPRYIRASHRSRHLLFAFLRQRTRSLRHILLKLQVACDIEDYLTDALNPACGAIAPHAIAGAVWDLEEITVGI